jgi:hypothetical protein
VLRTGLTLILACAAFFAVPAIASADMTVSGTADSNVLQSGTGDCSYTSSAATSNVDVGEIQTCLQDGDAVILDDTISASPASCQPATRR